MPSPPSIDLSTLICPAGVAAAPTLNLGCREVQVLVSSRGQAPRAVSSKHPWPQKLLAAVTVVTTD